MKWFEGGIEGAVKQAHANKALFCVAILGTDDDSTNLLQALESSEVQSLIVKEGFVFIRIEADSPEHVYFTQLYAGAARASIYCISNNGTPVEIILGSNSNELVTRLTLAAARHQEVIGIVSVSVGSGNQASPSSAGGTPSPVSVSTVVPEPNPNPSPAPINPDNSTTTDTAEAQQAQATLEERIERAKKLAAAKQQKKLAEEAEENKRREFERREAGRGAAELKRWQDEQEAKKLVEERRKDKLEDAVLRKRIKDQIAQDRIDRQARVDREAGLVTNEPSSATPNPTMSTVRPSTQTSANYSGQARLQFRLPDGSTHSSAFEPGTSLGTVRQYLLDNSVVPNRDFSLWVAFPRREFTSADYSTSLRDLGLLPSAALLIIPAPDNSILANAANAGAGLGNLLYQLIGYLLFPLNFVLGFFRPALAPAPSPSGPGNPRDSKTPGESRRNPRVPDSGLGQGNVLGGSAPTKQSPSTSTGSSPSSSGPGTSDGNFPPPEKRAKGSGSSGSKTRDNFDGTVHRLRTAESDSDEEKATWNGNSTQQM